MSGSHITDADKEAFLAALEATGTIKAASMAIGRDRRGIYRLMARDEEFKRRVDEARRIKWNMNTEDLYDEGLRRALSGSDPLLKFYLEAHMAEFRKQLDVHHDVVALNDGQLAAKLAAVLANARHRRDSGEAIDAEFTEPAVLPAPEDVEDLL